jgi:DNA-binding NarL/FixJ family response regulator
VVGQGQDRDDAGEPDDGSVISVLVVDDEPAIRTLVRMLLERADGFELAGEAADGAEGIELATRLQPDVVLLDLLMPGVDGREALPHIIRESPRSMVVVLSALSGVDEAEPSFTAGAFAYIEKSALGRLTQELTELHDLFKRALAGA